MHPLRYPVLYAALAAFAACRTPATAVEVGLGTDVPADRVMSLAMRFEMNGHSVERTWQRGDGDGGIALPASFTLLPRDGATDDEVGNLRITATLAATGMGAPEASITRVARFRFARHVTQRLPIFIPYGCTALVAGCTQHSAAECTASTLCEERGQTCGDGATCVAPDVTPVAIDHVPSVTWLADTLATDASNVPSDAGRCLFVDPFATASLGTAWTGFDQAPGAAQFSWGQGALVIAPHVSAAGVAYAGIETRALRDLRDASVSVEVQSVTSGAASETELVVVDDAWEADIIAYRTTLNLRLWDVARSTPVSNQRQPFDPVMHRYWRLRAEPDGNLNWEVSPDRSTWQTLRRAITPIRLESAYVLLSAGTWQADPSPGTARFAHFEIDAPCP